jgi:hypothetical protein
MNCIFKAPLCFTLICFVSFTAPAQTGIPNTDWYTANPSANVFTIYTADELAGLAQIVNGTWGGSPECFNFRDKTINLANNIDLSDYGAGYNNGIGWTPIGITNLYNRGSFSGTFDGNGNIITGLYIDRDTVYSGLFGYIMGDESIVAVKNLGIENANITSTADKVGAVIGHISSGSVINCYSTGSVAGKINVGGVVGFINGGTIANCYSTASVDGYNNVGGVQGHVNGSKGSVRNCYSTGSVNGNDCVGGVAGYVINGGSVKHCYSTAAVNGHNYIGGLVGNLNDTSIVEYCAALNPYITATISGSAGRVVSTLSSSQSTLNNNLAWDEIAISKASLNISPNTADGANITNMQILSDNTIAGLFVNNGNPWAAENGKLPGLGIPVPMPEYLTENAGAAAPVISAHPQSKTVQADTTFITLTLSVTANVTDGGTLSYQWYTAAVDSNTDGTLITDATNATYIAAATEEGTVYYYVVVTNTNNNVGGEQTASVRSYAAAVTVEPAASVISRDRDAPKNKPNTDLSDIPPANGFSEKLSYGDANKFTAGPNPAARDLRAVKFFWQGAPLEKGTLFIYDASGNLIKKIDVSDCKGAINRALTTDQSRRLVGKWDLTNSKGRPVCEGTYIIKGTIITRDGDKERITLVIGVR